MAEVRRLLENNRLLTLTGPGDCGKTRLALAAAGDAVGRFRDGVWLAELAPVADPALVGRVVGSALGARGRPGRPMADALSEHLGNRQVLLLLDNCEHLVETCAEIAEWLLRSCPGLRVLATSREALGVVGEVARPVPPLSLPDLRRLPDVGGLALYGAARLFVERAAAISPASRCLQEAGFSTNAAVILNILNGVASVSGITVAILVMNRINRRTMLLFGFVGITVAHLLIGLASLTLPEGAFRAYMILLFVVIFVFIMQGTAGPLVWLMLAEIFPLEMRGFAIGISVFLLWITNFFVGLSFPSLLAGVGISSTFFLFAAIGVISIVFIYTMVPETRGRTLEQLEEQFRQKFGQADTGSPQAARVK